MQKSTTAIELRTTRVNVTIAFTTLVACLLSLCLASTSQAQSGGQERDNKARDFFGKREQFKQPKSRSRQRHPVALQRFRTIDGSSNNLRQPKWGMTGVNLRRRAPADYGDGVDLPAGMNRKSAREISNLIFSQVESIKNGSGLTSMVWQWGQFLDHDIDLTEPAEPHEPFFIGVPSGDPFFDPFNTANAQIQLFRSAYRDMPGPRQQVNQITSWIDGSNVYGSDDSTALSLRTMQGGLMKQSTGGLLPLDDDGFFMAGDIRANEQLGLIAMHTLFVREHNRIASRYALINPRLSDEQIYLRARQRVISIMQAITFNEFLPALLGPDALRRYRGYRPDVNPNIANVFSTAAYRFGHTMLPSELLRCDNEGDIIPEGNIALRDAFFNPGEVKLLGIDSIIKGLTVQPAQEIDAKVIDDVRNFLFGPPGSGGFDLVSLNIQRGRDHGLPDLNRVRVAFKLKPHRTFADITDNVGLQMALAESYESVDDIDAWVGMLSEDHARGAAVGETIRTVLSRQFESLRDGDRFWYESVLPSKALESIGQTRLRNVIIRNTGVRNLPLDIFSIDD